MFNLTLEQFLKILGVSFLFGTTVAALKQDINTKANKETVLADSIYIRDLEQDMERTMVNINNRLSRMEDRLTEICKATRAGCR